VTRRPDPPPDESSRGESPRGASPRAESPRGDQPTGSGTPPAGVARRERKAMLLRLDPAVHEALAHWAADDLRSLNGHVEWILRQALKDAGRSPKR